MNKAKRIILTVVLAAALGGASFFGYMFMNGLSGIRINPQYKEGQIKVACVGDSVTYGHSIKNWPRNNYPALLSDMLGEDYHVCSYGVSGSTVQPDGDQPYNITKAYTWSHEYEADILVFMMGSNDSKPENWKGEEAFLKQYNAMLDTYVNVENPPKVYLCAPPVANFPEGVTQGLTNYDIQPVYVETVAELVRQVAEERGYELIDIFKLTEGHRELFGKDNVHPNNDGAMAIATEIYNKISL
ncbi:MAG: hypothetical protein IJ491_03700 [Clostridia bacterium]|nr:hypothetical protein [Clostridia bacterium]